MHANDLRDLGEAIERRAKRAVETALRCSGQPCGGEATHADLCRKLIADEVTSEWLRMHQGRRLKRSETALLVRMFRQVDDAVSDAIAHVTPAAMPAAARGAIVALAAPAPRRT